MVACVLEYQWYYYIAVGLIWFFGGLVLLIPCRFIWYLSHKEKYDDGDPARRKKGLHGCFSRIRAGAVNALSGQDKCSKTLVVIIFIFNMASAVTYLVEATRFSRENCGRVRNDPIQLFYNGLCCVFTLHFIMRFVAATDKLYFWLDVYSIVDAFTIGPTFYGLYNDVNWLGLRFLRLLYLLQLPEVLQATHLLKSSSKIRLAQIATIFISIWFTSSGFVHLCENSGDPFHEYSNFQAIAYFEGVYWLLVTMSTVGYGEFYPVTDIGRTFIVIYIMCTFAMFTAIVPELVRHLGKSTKYHKPYKRTYGKRHMVVCGYINYESVSHFIRNFIHEDAENTDVDVVFIDSKKPDLELEAFFKRRFTDVTFIQGSVMDITCLRKCKLRDAEAILIMANRKCDDPDEEDAANIMRATAVKNYNSDIRVIIQLLQYHNKTYLLHIPSWNWDKVNGDDVICISELKMGLMAQNCLAPGVSTLMSNLFTMRSFKDNGRSVSWQDNYRYGAGNEIYVESFSPAFVGLSFSQAAEICFTELHILLLAIQSESYKCKGQLRVNPQKNATLGIGTIGFFIAQAPEDVRRVAVHIPKEDTKPVPIVAVVDGSAKNGEFSRKNYGQMGMKKLSTGEDDNVEERLEYLEGIGSRLAEHRQRRPSLDFDALPCKKEDEVTQSEMFDYTGMFHWCTPRDVENCIVDYDSVQHVDLHDHVVLCLLSDTSCPQMGLVNFVMPLRTSNFKLENIHPIVILGSPDYISKEWDSIASFPKIYIFNGSPSHRPDLRAVNLDKCCMCVIMSAKKHILVDSTLLDKETILTNLNVKGMFGDDVESKIQSLGVLANPEQFRANVEAFNEIPISTELEIDSNVAFMDQDDDDDPDTPLYMTQPFASGSTFAASCLDSLMSTTFQDSQVLTVIRALVTGGETAEFEQILAEGLGIVRKHSATKALNARERSHMAQLPLLSGPLADLQVMMSPHYGSLFVKAMRKHGILCLGLYRLMDPQGRNLNYRKRYVVTNPPYNFVLHASDKVYCLLPSSFHPMNKQEIIKKEPNSGDFNGNSGINGHQNGHQGCQDEPSPQGTSQGALRPREAREKHGKNITKL